VIAVCPVLTGGEGFQDMELFGKTKRAWLQTFLALPYGMPSHATFGRVFARLNPQRFQECLVSWTQAVAQLTRGALISLEGKTAKASFDRATARSPLPMVSAWCAEQGGLVVGPCKTDTTSHEITAIPELLQLLAITGGLVTIEAMGCQTASAEQIRAQGGDYLLARKNNHKKASTAIKAHVHQQIEHQLAWRDADHCFDAFDNAHGRRVRRRVWVITDLEALPALAKWPNLQAVVVVETIRMAHKQAPVTSDYRVYLSSLVRSATDFVTMIRQHGHIENTLHWS
jgi:predicted transposase YbfD/YdcC